MRKIKRMVVKTNMRKKGIYLIITAGFRSKEQQDKLFAQGRTYSLERCAKDKENT